MPYNLPGFASELRDTRMYLTNATTSGRDRILILGTAVDGPVNIPVVVNRVDDADRLFGEYTGDSYGATLLPALHQALSAGAGEVRVMRVGGEYAKLTLKDEAENEVLEVRGQYPGVKYNSVKVEVAEGTEGKELIITDLLGVDHKYILKNYASYGSLAQAINSQANDASAVVVGAVGASVELALASAETLAGGDDGINKTQEQLYTAMSDALDLLVDYDVDIIVVAGLYVTVNGSSVGFEAANLLAKHCYEASQRVGERHGVIAVQPIENPTLDAIKNTVDALAQSDVNLQHDSIVGSNGEPLDVGKYISIVFAEPIYSDHKLGVYTSDGASSYAGLITTLAPESATTNKVVNGVQGMRYILSPAQLNNLASKRFVTLRNRVGRGVVVTDGVTAARPGSDYGRLSTVRIVNAAIGVTREATEPFIGEAGTPQHFNSMQTAIESGLSAMKMAGAIVDYRFTILANPMDLARGEAVIELELVPAFELRKIKTVVTVRASFDDAQ